MSDQALAAASKSEIIERVLIAGDLSKLSSQERTNYYMKVCDSMGLNPMTQPFAYITLNGKLTLYARKDCADQLRRRDNISIGKPDITFQDDLIIVAVEASDANGRKDSDVGVVKKGDMRGDVSNAIMKAITKAKRRVTLSICGLGMLDETEVETIPGAKPFSEPEPQQEKRNGNGNGHNPAAGNVDDQARMEYEAELDAYENACAILDANHQPYGQKTTEQLTRIVNAPEAPAERKAAAKLIIEWRVEHNAA